MHIKTFVKDKIEGIVGYLKLLIQAYNFLTDAIRKLDMFFNNFLVPFWQYIIVVAIDLLIIDRHLVTLFFGQWNIFKIFKYAHFLFSSYETVLELEEKLFE